MPREQNQTQKGERQLQTKVFKQFKGCSDKSDRTAMPPDKWFYLENMMTIGDANLHTVPNISAAIQAYGADTIYWSQFFMLGTTGYQISFATNGKVFAYNYSTLANAQINSGNLLSGAGSRFTPFMNLYALFSDSGGLYKWDGTTFAKLTGADFPTSGVDICTYADRVWVASGRLLTCSAAYDGTGTTDPTNDSAWQAANGAAFVNFTDPALIGIIQRLTQQNGFLYVAGTTCLWGVTSVYVPAGASPPTPVMTIYNIQAMNGTDQPASMVPYGNHMLFANRWGAWLTDGQQAQQLSEDIDGTWQYLSFTPSISAGQCVVNNKLCAAFLLKRSNNPNFGSNTVIGLFFDQKWWFANFGTVTFISTAIIGNVPTLVAFIGNTMYTLFTDITTAPNGIAVSPLWDMEDALSAKQVLRAGAKVVIFGGSGLPALTVDGQGTSLPIAGTATSYITFVNNSGGAVIFVGTGTINWTAFNQYLLFNGVAAGTYSSNVGMTFTSGGIILQLCFLAMDWKLDQPWSDQ